MKKQVIGALLLLAVVTAAAAGCGGGGSHPPPTPVMTYTLFANEQETVPFGTCFAIPPPYTVGKASFNFDITDTPIGGADNMEVGILADSFYVAGACDFTHALIDMPIIGSYSSSQSPVYPADTYDFIVACNNLNQDCSFKLSWTATY